LQALESAAKHVNYEPQLLKAVQQVNHQQKQVLFQKILQHFKGNLANKVIALWGLAFKPHTDDMREASSRTLMELLWQAGARVQAYDPVAVAETKRLYGNRADLILCKSPEETLSNADALTIVTEWPVFFSPDFNLIKTQLREPVIFDGRNLYDTHYLNQLGFTYYAIGRGASINRTL
jgi:UDPglucose 6-dehydrogenase